MQKKILKQKTVTDSDIERLTDTIIEVCKYIILLTIIILTLFIASINLNLNLNIPTFEESVKANEFEIVQATFYPEYIDINGKEFTHINDKGLSSYYEKQSYSHELSNEAETHNVYYNKSNDYSVYTEKGLKSLYDDEVNNYVKSNEASNILVMGISIVICISLLYGVYMIFEEWITWNSTPYQYIFKKIKKKHAIQF